MTNRVVTTSGEHGMRTAVGRTHQPLRIAVCDELRRRIIAGAMPQGERILEEELAVDLGVSRNPVREAIQSLAHEGFVELEPRRGARVAVLSDQRVIELFEVREGLEALVASLAATRRTDEQLRSIQGLLADGRRLLGESRLEELPALNTSYHASLVDMAANPVLGELLAGLAHRIEWVYARRLRERGIWSWDEHARIVDEIAAQHPTRAAAAAAEHIRNARDAYFASRAV
jgi:DNA-binding GntR family transcriptional regulator